MQAWARGPVHVAFFDHCQLVALARMVTRMVAPHDKALMLQPLGTALKTVIWHSEHNAPQAPAFRPWNIPTLNGGLQPELARMHARPAISSLQLFTTFRVCFLPPGSPTQSQQVPNYRYSPLLLHPQLAAIVHHSSQLDMF